MKTPKSSLRMKYPSKMINNLLNDTNVLYIVSFIAFINILGYLIKQNFEVVLFFLLVGFLTTYFSTNMNVILLSAMIATNLFAISNISFFRKEGMANKNKKGVTDKKSVTDKKNK